MFKKISYAASIFFILISVVAGQNRWEQMDGPYFANIQALVMDLQHPDTLFASTDQNQGGIYKTIDGGENWVQIGFHTVYAIAVDPLNPDRVYSGQKRSIDGGLTWLPMSGLNITPAVIKIDPVNPYILYAGSKYSNILMKSNDYGENWNSNDVGIPPGTGSHSIRSIAINPENPSTVYASTQNSGLFKSTINGDDWTLVGFSDNHLGEIVISSDDTSTLYLALEEGLFKSVDNGVSWQSSGFTEPVMRIVESNRNTNVLYVISEDSIGILESQDAGDTWVNRTNNLSNRARDIRAVVVHPTLGNVIYIGTKVGIYNTDNSSFTWTQRFSGFRKTQVGDFSISNGLLYAGTSNGVYEYTNFEWQDRGLNEVWSIESSLGNTDILYAVEDDDTSTRRLFRSLDRGQNWEDTGIRSVGSMPITVAQSNFERVYTGAWRSDDLGSSWTQMSTEIPTYEYGQIAVDFQNEDLLFMATYDDVYKSIDGGYGWESIGFTGAPGFKCIAVNPDSSEVLYVSIYNSGFFKSTNGGIDWIPMNSGLTNFDIFSICIHPVYTEMIFVGSLEGVFYSVNGGGEWHTMSEGLPSIEVISLAVDTLNLYAGLRDFEGAYKMELDPTALEIEPFKKPSNISVLRNFPNPFNPSTTIEYELPEHSDVLLTIYDIAGREVQTLVSKAQPVGSYKASWNGTNQDGKQVAGGMYFARLQAGEYSSVVKMVYLR